MFRKSKKSHSNNNTSSNNICFLLQLPNELLLKVFNDLLPDLKDASRFATITNKEKYFKLFKPNLDKLELWQSIVDNDIEKIKEILDSRPDLLLQSPNFVVQAQMTKSFFYISEKPLEFALKRRQLEVVRTILPYFNHFNNGLTEVFAQWKVRELSAEEKEMYDTNMQKLFNVIATQDFSEATVCDLKKLCEEEETVKNFINSLFPGHAISLNKYPDAEQLFLSSFKAFSKNDLDIQHQQVYQEFILKRIILCIPDAPHYYQNLEEAISLLPNDIQNKTNNFIDLRNNLELKGLPRFKPKKQHSCSIL